MTEVKIADDLLEKLRAYDTPTVCNAIELAEGRRGFAAFTKSTMLCSASDGTVIVGFARTARIAGLNAPIESADVLRSRRIDYFRSMSKGPRPAIAVVEDLDWPNCVAAWWGEVHSAVHKGLGLAGAVTNGVMRDLGDLEPGFPIVAGSIGPSHAYCHVREIGSPVDVFGLRICEGDLVHADRHGALVIPISVLPKLSDAIDRLLAAEQVVLDPARRANFSIEKLEQSWAEFEKLRV